MDNINEATHVQIKWTNTTFVTKNKNLPNSKKWATSNMGVDPKDPWAKIGPLCRKNGGGGSAAEPLAQLLHKQIKNHPILAYKNRARKCYEDLFFITNIQFNNPTSTPQT